MQGRYAASFRFPNSNLPTLAFSLALGCNLDGSHLIALIGRDVLQHFVMIYDGINGRVTLAI